MKKNQNPGKDKIGDLRNLFLETIALVDKYLGDKAFSNFGEKKGKWASLSNRSIYDAEMLAFSDFVGKNITITSDEFVENLERLMVNLEFRKSLHSQAGGKMIEKRVAEIKKLSLIQKFNMEGGKSRILDVLNAFTGREGEPKNESESYTLKAMWLMMLSEFEASVKQKAENYIDEIKKKDISDIHICLLARNFYGDSAEELTLNKVVSCYKKNPKEINYRNFTQDKVPKYKSQAVEKLFNNMGVFFTEEECTLLAVLDSVASTRDSIAHGDIGVEITRKQLEEQLQKLSDLSKMLEAKLA